MRQAGGGPWGGTIPRGFAALRAACLVLLLGVWVAQGAAAQGDAASALARIERASVGDVRGGLSVTLDLSQGVPWRVFTMDDPWRVVLDFREADMAALDAAALAAADGVTEARMGGYRPGWSRMVLGLSEPMIVARADLAVAPETGSARLALRLRRTDADTFAATAGLPADPDWGAPRVVAAHPAARDSGRLLVVLDPGHGGIDPGAQRGGYAEADLMLTFARDLRDVLRRTGRYDVALTRDADVFVSLEARIAAAQDAGADLFVSLHADAIEEGVAHGATVYTLSAEASDAASAAMAERHDRDDLLAGLDLSGTDDRVAQVLMDLARLDNAPRSRALAGHVVDGIRNALGRVHKRPLRQAAFSVLKAPGVPSVLIEVGFLSTDRDLRNLQDAAWRAGMAAGIRDGIDAWAVEDAALRDLRRR